MNKVFINLIAFILALVIILILFIFNKELIVSKIYPSMLNISTKSALEKDLESGKIIIFGSSELTNRSHKFIPQNYFNKDLKMPLRVNGHAGHQNFAIMSQLATCSNKYVRENARVVIFLSPGWFHGGYSQGTSLPNFLEYMYSEMIYKLYFKSDIDEKYKILISNYIKNNILKIKGSSFIYKYASLYASGLNTYDNFDTFIAEIAIKEILKYKDTIEKIITYKNPNLNLNLLKEQALKVSKASTNNEYGIYNYYYTKYIAPKIKNNKFPFTVATPAGINKNQEYKDFLNLLDLLKDYKIKPLFIMQDLNPYAYVKNRDSMNPILTSIKNEIIQHGYGYLDMWSYKQEDYEMGTLTDIMHTGELGWVKINQKIIEHFITNKEIKK
jgi:D-alanine transfer protein